MNSGGRSGAEVRAAYIEALGGPESIRYGELPDPAPSAGQVVVRVEAVGVNSVDTYLRSGRWPTEVTFPLAVGRDLVGTVAAVDAPAGDASAGGFEVGERVWTNSAGYGGRPGATAELVAVEPDRLYRLPSDADPVAFVAAVHPGATAASSGIDVFVDASGRADVAAAAKRLAPRGRIVLIAGRRRADFELWEFYVREAQLLGFIMSAMTVGELAAAADWINATYPARPLSVSVGRVSGFDSAGEAHSTLEAGALPRMGDGTVGRLVLRP